MDSKARNFSDTGVKFWIARIALAPIQPARMREVSKLAIVFIFGTRDGHR